jgi:hypothetical protein
MFAVAFGKASAGEREAIKADLAEAFTPFATADGYDLPGVALCAVAR